MGRGGGGRYFIQYVETVLQLITSTPQPFNVIVHHIPYQVLRLFDFNPLKERGYRLSGRYNFQKQVFLQTPGTTAL